MTKSGEHQHKLIAQGLCPQCKRPKDREGWYCSECQEKHNKRRSEDIDFFIKHGLCRVCGKNKSQPNSTYCEECSQYMYRNAMRNVRHLESAPGAASVRLNMARLNVVYV